MGPIPRLLGENDREAVMDYVSLEPEMNIFITGDIEKFGMEDPVNLYALENEDGSWDSIVCKFYANFVCYSQNPLFDAEAMSDLIRKSSNNCFLGSINGKYEVIDALSPYFEELDMRSLHLAFLDLVYHDDIAPAPEGVTIRRLTYDDYDELFELLDSMHEYRGLYSDTASREMAKKQKRANEERGCVSYGAFYKGKLVSAASTSAASSESAMVVGIGTRDDLRGNGLATSVVATLCQDCLDSGMKFLALFYENPSAGRIYHRIGFGSVGKYGMLR